MNDSRLPVEVTGDERGVLSCEGVTLESTFIDTAAPRGTVVVSRVDPSRSAREARPASVVKFSEEPHAIPRSESLKLATPRYYREFGGAGGGIRDEMEAQYQEDVRSVFAKAGTVPPSATRYVTGHVTYGVDGFWVFCTSIRPPSTWRLEQLRQRFGAERATTIADPSAFAEELGAAFAAQASWPDVDLSFVEKFVVGARPPWVGRRMVWVRHGAVCYSDDPRKLVESFPDHHQAAILPFIKRRMYSWQREYRFTVSIDGQATENECFLPITPGLRRLAHLE